MRSRMAGFFAIAEMSRLRRVTMARGVPAGATMPYQTVASNPGSVSATVGRSGSAVARFALVMDSAFSLPVFTCGIAPGVEAKVTWMAPLMTSATYT